MEKPFLADKFQIAWSELKPENIVSDITEAIEIAQNQVDLISQPSPAGDELTFENRMKDLSEMKFKKFKLVE